MLIGCSETELVVGRDMLAPEGKEHRIEIGQLSNCMNGKGATRSGNFISIQSFRQGVMPKVE